MTVPDEQNPEPAGEVREIKELSENDRARIVLEHAGGAKIQDLADRYGVSKRTIQRTIKRALERRPKAERAADDVAAAKAEIVAELMPPQVSPLAATRKLAALTTTRPTPESVAAFTAEIVAEIARLMPNASVPEYAAAIATLNDTLKIATSWLTAWKSLGYDDSLRPAITASGDATATAKRRNDPSGGA